MSTNPLLSAPFTHSWPRPADAGHSRSVVRHGVLVVDDDPAFARSVADALADRDIEAITVTDAQEALGLARRRPFAAAVVDLIMPDMDGLELARELRRASPSDRGRDAHRPRRHALGDRGRSATSSSTTCRRTRCSRSRLRRAVRAAIARSELRAENRRLVAGLQEHDAQARGPERRRAQRLAAEHAPRPPARRSSSRAARELVEARGAPASLLMERNELGDMTIRAAYGDGEVALGGPLRPRRRDRDGTWLETGAPVRVDVAADHPSYSRALRRHGHARCRGFLCVPLARPTLTGVLSRRGPSAAVHGRGPVAARLARAPGRVAIENAQTHEVNRNFFTHASDMLVSLLDAQDAHYEGHSRAVAALTDMVTRRLGLPEEERRTLHFAALLHDVGKLRLQHGLLAPDALTGAEREPDSPAPGARRRDPAADLACGARSRRSSTRTTSAGTARATRAVWRDRDPARRPHRRGRRGVRGHDARRSAPARARTRRRGARRDRGVRRAPSSTRRSRGCSSRNTGVTATGSGAMPRAGGWPRRR